MVVQLLFAGATQATISASPGACRFMVVQLLFAGATQSDLLLRLQAKKFHGGATAVCRCNRERSEIGLTSQCKQALSQIV